MSSPLSINFSQKASQSLKQTQRLIMSPQMQQAINLLQLPILEINSMIDKELEGNPILEISEQEYSQEEREDNYNQEQKLENSSLEEAESINLEKDNFEVLQKLGEEFGEAFLEQTGFVSKKTEEEEKKYNHQTASIQGSTSFFSFLLQQAKEVFDTKKELHLAEVLIGNLDKQGFFTGSIEELALLENCEEEELEEILKEIQTFEPYGVGARSFQESLLIQLSCLKKQSSLAYEIIEKHFDDLLHNRIPNIAKKLKHPLEKIMEAVEKDIAKLDFHPGNYLSQEKTAYIIPDLFFIKEGSSLRVEINEEEIPLLRINSKYLKMLEDDEVDQDTKEYIIQKIASGKWLLQNLHHRNSTLRKIADLLIEHQRDYLLDDEGKLAPLTMKLMAQQLELHESTIARAVANKYVSCIKGLIPLRSFFTNAFLTSEGEDISSRTVKDLLKEIIETEDKTRPLSDQTLSKQLQDQGIPCARRTVAKYRKELSIGNTTQRKKFSK